MIDQMSANILQLVSAPCSKLSQLNKEFCLSRENHLNFLKEWNLRNSGPVNESQIARLVQNY